MEVATKRWNSLPAGKGRAEPLLVAMDGPVDASACAAGVAGAAGEVKFVMTGRAGVVLRPKPGVAGCAKVAGWTTVEPPPTEPVCAQAGHHAHAEASKSASVEAR